MGLKGKQGCTVTAPLSSPEPPIRGTAFPVARLAPKAASLTSDGKAVPEHCTSCNVPKLGAVLGARGLGAARSTLIRKKPAAIFSLTMSPNMKY